MLYCTPKVFNEINLTVILGQEHTNVPCALNCLLDEGLLGLEIGLVIQDSLGTAVGLVVIAPAFAASQIQASSPKATFLQHHFCPLGHTWKLRM